MFIFPIEGLEPFTLSRQLPTKAKAGGNRQEGFTFTCQLAVAGTAISVPVTFRVLSCSYQNAIKTRKWLAEFVSGEDDSRLKLELTPLDRKVKVDYVGIKIERPASGSKRIQVSLLPNGAPQKRAVTRKPARQRLRVSQEAARAAV